MSKEYNDRGDKPLREQYLPTVILYDKDFKVIAGPMPWSGGQTL